MRRSAFLAAAFSALPAAAVAQSNQLTVVHVGVIPSEVCGQVFYGLSQDSFKKNGLDVQIQSFTNGAAITAAIVGGALDIGLSDLSSAIVAHARGIAVGYVAPGLMYTDKTPTFAIIVPESSPIRTAKDIRGVFASSGLGNIAQLATEAWIDRNGGDMKNIKFVEMPPPMVQNALTQGTIQASTGNEPWLTYARGNGFRTIVMTNGMAPAYMLSGWAATKDWAQKNPLTVAKFVAAIHDVSVWANTHQSATAPALAKYTNVPQDVIERMAFRGMFAESWSAGIVQPPIDAAAKLGKIPQAFPAADMYLGRANTTSAIPRRSVRSG
jgi:NitT/TauT family transport system substrate-binding protein